MKNLLKTGLAAVAGVTFGLLFAKKSGKQLRTKLAKSEHPLKDLADELKGVAQNTKEFASDKKNIEKLKSASKNMAKTAEEKIDGFVNKAKEEIENLKEGASDLKAEMNEKIDELKEGAEDIKKSAEKKIATAKKTAKSTVKKFKNKLDS